MSETSIPSEQITMQEQLFAAAQRDDVSHMRELLIQGADPNWMPATNAESRDQPVGVSCLHEAADWQSLDAIKLLVNWGADVNCTNPEGNTPLLILFSKPCAAGARELLDAGAKSQTSNNENRNARTMLPQGAEAESHDALLCMELLDEYDSHPRINVNSSPEQLKERLFKTDGNHCSPLDNPHVWQQFQVIGQVLMEQGTPLTKEDLEEVNTRNETVLERAVRYRALDDVLAHLREQGDRLTVEEITQKPAFLETVREYDAAHSLFTRAQLQDEGVSGMAKLKDALGEDAMDTVRNQFSLKAGLRAHEQLQTSLCR